jgi:uncharacterized protein YutE (UPF0331/DUF86 family)
MLRNRLAHEYDDIDERKVHDGAKAASRDAPAYLKAIDLFVAGRSG